MTHIIPGDVLAPYPKSMKNYTDSAASWQQNDYKAILDLAEKMPEDVLQEDAQMSMWHTDSLIRTGLDA